MNGRIQPRWLQSWLQEAALTALQDGESPASGAGDRTLTCGFVGVSGSALGGIRTPNLLIRSQMLYPLSYERIGPGESSVPAHGTKIGIGPAGGALDDACESLHKVPVLLHSQRWAYGVPITRNVAANSTHHHRTPGGRCRTHGNRDAREGQVGP